MGARVNVEPDRVFITSNSCQIRGSKIIEDLHINDFFTFQVEICLTWDSSSITAKSEMKVNLNPPGIFAIVPSKVLEVVGNQAIGIALGSLQKNFMRSLGADFERWSVDAAYRAQRKKLELEMDDGVPNKDETLMAYLKR